MPLPVPHRRLLRLLLLAAGTAGCEPIPRDALVVATSWPAAERRQIEDDLAVWLAQNNDHSPRGPIELNWLILAPGDDLEGLAGRRHPPDILLGGSVRSYERLAGAKRLAPLPIAGSPDWGVSREASIGPRTRGDGNESTATPDRPGIAFDDPRNDPISLAWAEAQLAGSRFPDGYARLVRAADEPRRIGRRSGSARAAVDRGDADLGLALLATDPSAPDPKGIPWPEGVAIVAECAHSDRAIAFLKFLASTGRARPASSSPRPERPTDDERELLADLLGATLVDAQDELRVAWAALDQGGSPPGPLRSMTEPPPWPPASVSKILGREGEQAMGMVETLAAELATDPASRAWLISSWMSPPRPIDRRSIEELTRAADGRLFREARFREWLRAEWTAWARQRYRRVARAVQRSGVSAQGLDGVAQSPLP